ncbi:DUF86 domain-containing protein [Candidatus Gottesmanbacteria bacterium]|nr:DUF86 domain-containing protein [Candidatus Gottesmanbacteria bacterium]
MTEDRLVQIQKKLEMLETYVSRIRAHAPVTAEELQTNSDKSSIIERNLQLASEVVLDIANQLIAEFRFRTPETYKDSITILGETGVLPKKFAIDFSGIAGFRNILVHNYMEIDYNEVADKANNRLGDFEIFARAVALYLQ